MKIKKHSDSKNLPSNKPLAFLAETTKKRHKPLRLRKLALAIALSFSVSAPNIAQAATYIVSNTNDSGVGSLRRAMQDANNVTPAVADTIEFTTPVGSTITLLSELLVTDSVTIKGPIVGDASSIVLDGGGTNRHINTGGFSSGSGQSITLENITLQNGFFDSTAFGSGYGGGAVFVKHADLVLKYTLISKNSTVGKNGEGGGLFVRYGNATLTRSTVSGNSTEGEFAVGGGLSARSGSTTLIQSTVSDNSTAGKNADGGGISARSGSATLIQSTVSRNSTMGSSADGGGLHAFNSKSIFTQSTITNNSAMAGADGLSIKMDTTSNNATLINTILAGNTGPEGNFHDRVLTPVGLLKTTNSLFGDPATEITDPASSGNYISNLPDLGPLQHNGGITQTHKPNANSPAFNTGSNVEAAAFNQDQRNAGFPRIHNGTVDMGAVELQNNTLVGDPPLNTDEVITRRDMARELLKGLEGENYIPLDPNNNNEPYQVTGIYEDVGVGDINAVFIEEFQRRGYTEGCANNKFCPNAIVTREEITKIFLNFRGSSPPPATNDTFDDVEQGDPFLDWVEMFITEDFTDGCDANNFCPKEPVTRKWFDFLLNEI